MVGARQDVLFEEIEDGYFTGHAPNYVKIYTETERALHNQVLPVRIVATFRDGVLAVLEDMPG